MNSLQHALRGWPFLLLALALGGFGTKALIDTQRRPEQDGRGGSSMNLDVHASGSSSVAKDGAGGTAEVTLPKDQWGAAGIELAQPKESEFNVPVTLTGKVSLNEDRISHIYPMVDGTVDSVSITLGQNVKADDLLIVVHSREIGQAKLNLYQARLQREIAIVKRDLQTKIAENTRRLIEELRSRRPIQDIEEKFRSLSMGDYRERLLASYANYLKAQADVNRLENVRDSGAVSSKLLLTAQSTRDGDLATFQARIEQIEYEIQTDILAANQTVKEAETRVAVDSTNLRILGVSSEDIESVDPTTQGQSISHYPIRAPFDGTVITKDCTVREQVRTTTSLLTVADLSTVWINADVFEGNVPLLGSLEQQTVTIVNEAWPDKTFQAKVFFTGEIMDEKTRTIALRAIAENTERLLKPGMFVNVIIPGAKGKSLMVPTQAVQEHDGKKFVFIHKEGSAFERRDIVTGPNTSQGVVVRSGITPEDSVVINGAFILKTRMLAELLGEE